MRKRLMRQLSSQAWAITAEGLEHVRAMLSDDYDVAPMREEEEAEEEAPEGVAIVSMSGYMVPHGNWLTRALGMCASDDLAATVRAAAQAPNIKAIVLRCATGGGAADGVSEVANEVAAAAQVKPIVAVVSHWACSGGYWVASQASKIVGTEDAHVGSIGVYLLHEDFSKVAEKAGVKLTWIKAGKNKAEGDPMMPLSADGKAHLTAYAETLYGRFVSAVAAGRGVSEETVRSEAWGQGRTIHDPKEAMALGMIDEIGTLRSVVDGLSAGSYDVKPRARRMAAEDLPAPANAEDVGIIGQILSETETETLADSPHIADNPDTRRAAAEENTMDEKAIQAAIEAGLKAGLDAAVAPLNAKIDGLSTKFEAEKAETAKLRVELADAKTAAAKASIAGRLEALVAEGRITPGDAQSEGELLAAVSTELAEKRLAVLAAKPQDFSALTHPATLAQAEGMPAGLEKIVTPAMMAADPAGCKLLAEAFRKAGGDPAKIEDFLQKN